MRLFDVLQILLSPQVKRNAIISNKHGACKVPVEVAKWHNLEMSGRSQDFIELLTSAQTSPQNKSSPDTSKTRVKNTN